MNLNNTNKTSNYCKQAIYWQIRIKNQTTREIIITKSAIVQKKVSIVEPRPRSRLKMQIAIKKIAIPEINQYKIKEIIISTEETSKIYKLILYNHVVKNLIHSRFLRKAIKNKIQNLKSH